MQARILPGRGRGARSRTADRGRASPSRARRSRAGRRASNRSMRPCIVSCGVWPEGTRSATPTTPRSVSWPGTASWLPGFWNKTSFMGRSLAHWRGASARVGPREETVMKTIDIHAHLVPQSLWQAADARREWYGFRHEPGDGIGTMLGGGKRTGFASPKVRFTPEERLKDMDAQGVDVQVVSIHTPFFGYHLDSGQGRALAREVNDEIAGMTRQWPQRFAGLATLPVQDVKAAIDELERAVTVLGLKGAELDTVVNGENWD